MLLFFNFSIGFASSALSFWGFKVVNLTGGTFGQVEIKLEEEPWLNSLEAAWHHVGGDVNVYRAEIEYGHFVKTVFVVGSGTHAITSNSLISTVLGLFTLFRSFISNFTLSSNLASPSSIHFSSSSSLCNYLSNWHSHHNNATAPRRSLWLTALHQRSKSPVEDASVP